MERLTYFDNGRWMLLINGVEYTGFPFVDRLAAYEDTMSIERAQELAQAEEAGRLVVLPFKIGTDVYISLRRAVLAEFFGYRTERYFQAQFYDDGQYIDIPFEEIGKTVFLTREEAEAALKKREESDDGKRT